MKAVYRYGLEKQPNFEELLDYVQNNNDKIQYPSRVFLNIYNDPTPVDFRCLAYPGGKVRAAGAAAERIQERPT